MPVKEAMKYISVRNIYFASFLRFFYWNLFRQCGIVIQFIINSLFRASGYCGQRIISLVIEAVKHSPFLIWFSPPKDGRLVVVRGSDVTPEKRIDMYKIQIIRSCLKGTYNNWFYNSWKFLTGIIWIFSCIVLFTCYCVVNNVNCLFCIK